MAPTAPPAVLVPQTKRSKKALATHPKSKIKGHETISRDVKDDASGLIITHIAPKGDLLLEFKGPAINSGGLYLVSSTTLRQASAYFRVLLDVDKFGEGRNMNSAMARLLEQYGEREAIPVAVLPKIALEESLPVHSRISIPAVIAFFLSSLHNVELPLNQPDTYFFVLVAILADRFDATAIVRDFIQGQGWRLRNFVWDGKYRPLSVGEEVLVRQQILIGLLLGMDQLFTQQSANLAIGGSVRWTGNVPGNVNLDAPWWDLPRSVEEELMSRREYILETIGSLQKHMVDLYIFEPNQCRYGYDSSPACNYYQLGQMVRFFRRTNTLELESSLYSAGQSIACNRNIVEVIAALRACPEYQIDENHKHCGIRNRFVAALQTIAPEEQAGICGHCWRDDAGRESWERNPEGAEWRYVPRTEPMHSSHSHDGCLAHRKAKAMYTAKSRDWTHRTPGISDSELMTNHSRTAVGIYNAPALVASSKR